MLPRLNAPALDQACLSGMLPASAAPSHDLQAGVGWQLFPLQRF